MRGFVLLPQNSRHKAPGPVCDTNASVKQVSCFPLSADIAEDSQCWTNRKWIEIIKVLSFGLFSIAASSWLDNFSWMNQAQTFISNISDQFIMNFSNFFVFWGNLAIWIWILALIFKAKCPPFLLNFRSGPWDLFWGIQLAADQWNRFLRLICSSSPRGVLRDPYPPDYQ